MASGLEILRDKRLSNGGLSNVNSQGSEDDPHCLMEEFCCLYSEKLKAIDEEYPDSLEPKCQALTELVSDLSEQNFMLLKTVEELEKEALCRAEAFSSLAEAAKETMQQDTTRRGSESKRSAELENKVVELQDALHQNELNLSSCMMEIERLTRGLKDKKLENGGVETASRRMSELENMILSLQADLEKKHSLILSLQMENERLQAETMDSNRRSEDISNQLEVLKEELRDKTDLLEKFNSLAFSPNQETRLNLFNEASVESSKNVQCLEELLEEKECLLKKITEERDMLQDENQQMTIELSTQCKRVEELNKEIECLKCLLEQNERELRNKESSIHNELQEANYALNIDQQRLKEYEEQIQFLENALFSVQKSPGDESKSLELFRCRIKCLQKEIEQKNFDIARYKSQEEKMKCELSQLRKYTNEIERQWEEKASYLGCEIEKKNILLQKYEKQLQNMKFFAGHDQKNYSKDAPSKVPHSKNRKIDDENDIDSLKFKLKDVQEALTAEIADKHDEIRRLKDDIKELEDKLLHSDKQTQFKDDIIKELRKEVKVGRAKESLAEMLGLKGTPRAAMKSRIDHLTVQLEEMRTHVLSLEERLAECNLPAVISLRSKLNNAESSLLAMFNKMDYVRRYLENLKGDEELSMKCGLQALLSELREDVEWNRQTRRNLSLDEGTSVIVINHRSHSLPDNRLHRSVSKAKSDSAVAIANKQSGLRSEHSLESFQECREYIQVVNDLINDFEDTRKKVYQIWNQFQNYTKNNGDNMLVGLNEVLFSFESSKEKITDIIGQLENIEESKVNSLCYHLECLKGNILEISDSLSLSRTCTVSDTSEAEFVVEGGDAVVKKRLSSAINDSLSIIQVLENLKINSQIVEEGKSVAFQKSFAGIISLIKTLYDEKENLMKKLSALKKQQLEFSQKLILKIKEFEESFSSYNVSSEGLRKETRKLFAIILAKEKQIQKQFDEIGNLKMALSSSKYVEEASEEIDSLRKVVSNKDIQLVEKQDLIQSLRYLNDSLRTRQLQNFPSQPVTADGSETMIEKSYELEEGLLNIKERFTALSSDIIRSKDKMVKFEVETKRLVEALTKTHQDIINVKETKFKTPEQLSSLDVSFTEAEFKVEELLNALEMFICDEQRDFREFTDSVSSYIEILLDIVEVIKKSINNEKLLTKALKDENNQLKEQLCKLQNRLTSSISQQTEISDEILAEDQCSKDELIQSLQEDLCRCNCYLEKIEEEYTALKLEKAEMEEKNQKVMEELQAKICNLQESLQNQEPEVVSNKSWIFSWPQNRQIRHVHDV